ncbi:MAG TPA: DUF2950 family protein [Candidatus Hydrogenedentes bacterium]|nr:DUF2950 family protein [Candidatus Hydrogenedentota bacterium]HPG67217.1 DUF2950 family protein [Candidatus Hydrogenedentota bacterium]
MNAPAKAKPVGLLLTALMAVGFILGEVTVVQWRGWPATFDVGDPPVNEARAVANLRRIAEAQERYRKTDWDGDGAFTYAQFPAHLWQAVDAEARPVPTRLVSKRLAFAMDYTMGLHGYYFYNLYARDSADAEGDPNPFDPQREWAVIARPQLYPQCGTRSFIIDQSGRIVAKDMEFGGVSVETYPGPTDGWQIVSE